MALVVSDVAMPEMTGIEMAREIRKLKPKTPILFISGAPKALQDEALQAVAEPRPALLRKPFKLKELLDAVRQHAG